MDFLGIFKGCNKEGVDFLVTGAVALNIHGVPRMTYDLDLIVDLDGGAAQKIADLLLGWGYGPQEALDLGDLARPDMRLRWIEEGRKVLRVVNEEADVAEIDISLDPAPTFTELKERGVVVQIHGIPVTVVGLEDLVRTKRRMGRAEDDADLKSIATLDRVAGTTEELPDRAEEQIRKFHFWPLEQRIEWLLTGSQLQRQSQPGSSRGRGAPTGRRGLKGRKKIPGLRHTDLS